MEERNRGLGGENLQVVSESSEMLYGEFEETFGRKPVDFAEFWEFTMRRLKPN